MKRKKIFIFIVSFIFLLFNNYCYAIDNESLYAESAVIIESNTGKVLYEKNLDKKMYPASTTKILTAILTIEHCNLDDIVTVNYNAISSIPSGYSTAQLVTDEELTVKQLLEVLLIHSANDAANVLGMHVGGSIESFVSMMNSKAQELGCSNTNFTNTYGLHDENHYTTARDLALIARYCMQNDTFRHFVFQTECQIAPTNKQSARTFNNTNDLIRPASKYYIPYAIGVKTGYTAEAGNCLISAFKKNGFETLAVILNTGSVPGRRYEDSQELYNYVYNNFEVKTLAKKEDIVSQITVKNGTEDTKNLDLVLSDDINALTMVSENNSELSPEIKIKENISAPISVGTVLGTVTYTVLNTEYSADLVASHNVERSELFINILRFGLIALIVIVLIVLIFYKLRKKSIRTKFEI